jgi:hypothetical protein
MTRAMSTAMQMGDLTLQWDKRWLKSDLAGRLSWTMLTVFTVILRQHHYHVTERDLTWVHLCMARVQLCSELANQVHMCIQICTLGTYL